MNPSQSPAGGKIHRWLALRAITLLSLGCVVLVSHSFAAVEISEFVASNTTTLTTTNGLYEDWIEIHNGSGAAVDLAGWYLTDDPADLRPQVGAFGPRGLDE